MKKFRRLFMTVLLSLVLVTTSAGIFLETTTVQAASKNPAGSRITLIKGNSVALSVEGVTKRPVWKSSRPKVASVGKKGMVKAKKAGTARITATVNGRKYSWVITVEAPALNETSATITIGEKLTLKVNGTKQKVTWKSSRPKVATVSSKGVVTGIHKGKANIAATVAGMRFACKVTVQSVPKPTETPVPTATPTPFLTPEPSVTPELSVTPTPSVTPTLSVTPTPTGTAAELSASQSSVAIKDVGTVDITYTGKEELKCEVADPQICSCKLEDLGDGIHRTLEITGLSSGSTIITVSTSDNEKSISIQVTVEKEEEPVSITLNETEKTLSMGQNFELTATVSPAGAESPALIWKSDNESVATVSFFGVVHAVSEGTALITVSTEDGKASAQCVITVGAKYPQEITFTQTELSLDVGDSSTLFYTVHPLDADQSDLKWSSSNEGVATVSSSGRVEGISEGTAVITLSSEKGNCKAECNVTVEEAPGAVIQTPDLPITLGDSEKSCTITGINLSTITIGVSRVAISVEGEKTADANGNTPCVISYQLVKDGVPVKSGTLTTPEIPVGGTFSLEIPSMVLEKGVYQFELTGLS